MSVIAPLDSCEQCSDMYNEDLRQRHRAHKCILDFVYRLKVLFAHKADWGDGVCRRGDDVVVVSSVVCLQP